MRTSQLLLFLAALAAPAFAQGTNKAQVFSSSAMHQQFMQLQAQAKAQGSSGSTLGDYGTHAIKLSLRTVSDDAEVHAHFDDVIFVTAGKADLITGGTVIDPHTGADGEMKGKAIQNGTKQTITAGAVVNIPAGTPHQMILTKGSLFQAVVVKLHEP
jgi:quercetin dioxygenase-like cupin family protein